jgi:DNA polymerase III sliding clamp (beta) subunit (PCNA family)
MQLSKQTIEVLKNFASINQNILIRAGNKLTTRTVAKNIYVEATVPDTFEQEFGIYNLSEFLGITTLFSEPVFELSDSCVYISQGKNRVQYMFASPEVLDYPDKPIPTLETDAQFLMNEDVLKSLLKAGAVLSSTDLRITGADGIITCTVLDPKNPSSNTFSVEVGTTDRTFDVYIKLSNLKMPAGSYDVLLTSKRVANFKNTAMDYSIFIANEKNTSWS